MSIVFDHAFAGKNLRSCAVCQRPAGDHQDSVRRTGLTEPQLVALRKKGFAQRSYFVDPDVIAACCAVLDRRGELWATEVLGRDISRRSVAVRHRPFLRDGEEYILVLADAAEDEQVVRAHEWNGIEEEEA